MSRVLKKTSEIDCPARTVKEETLHQAVMDAVGRIFQLDQIFFEKYRKSVETAFGANGELEIRQIEEALIEKQKELLTLPPGDARYDLIADEIYELREKKRQSLMNTASRQAGIQKVDDLMTYTKERKGAVTEYDDTIVRTLLEKVIVFDDHFKVIFKAGMEVEVKA